MKKVAMMFFYLLVFLPVYSQFVLRRPTVNPQPADSLDISYYSEKHFWRSAGTVFSLNIGVWAFDRYIQKGDFAYISLNTMKDNLKSGFKWDNDQMGSNLFLHPYHGNLYYNTARSNGYNLWESTAFAFGGSLMWELFMENEKPSLNDIIATPVGGVAMGEVLYRTSDLILDDSRRGRNRTFREISAFLVSPGRGITRLLNGDMKRVRPTSGRQFGIPELSVEISTGLRILELRDAIFDTGTGWATDISIEYGDRFDSECKKPYDYFNFRLNLNIHKSQPLLGQLNIIGRLWGTEIIDNKYDHLSFGFYQHFDYYDSDTISDVSSKIPYKFGTPASLGAGMVYRSQRYHNWQFDAYGHFTGVILGASLSDHYLVDERNYNLCSGFGWKWGVNISYKDKGGFSWWYEGFRMYTWKGYPEGYDLSTALENDLDAQGDKSDATLNTSSFRVDIKLIRQLYFTGVFSVYRRSTRYANADLENVRSTTGEGRIMLTCKF